jgi:hypothetical protein
MEQAYLSRTAFFQPNLAKLEGGKGTYRQGADRVSTQQRRPRWPASSREELSALTVPGMLRVADGKHVRIATDN